MNILLVHQILLYFNLLVSRSENLLFEKVSSMNDDRIHLSLSYAIDHILITEQTMNRSHIVDLHTILENIEFDKRTISTTHMCTTQSVLVII